MKRASKATKQIEVKSLKNSTKNIRREIDKNSLLSQLRRNENQLLILARRYHFLKDFDEAIETELGNAKNVVKVRNDIVMQLKDDTFDMLLNDLTSFCEGMTQKKGLLEIMKSGKHHIKMRKLEEFEVSEPNIINSHEMTEEQLTNFKAEIKIDIAKNLLKGQKEILNTLFPKSKKRKEFEVTEKDINLLVIEFKKLYKSAKHYRDNISAHRYEGGNKKVARPSLAEVKKIIAGVENQMNHIRVILDNSSFAYSNMFVGNTKATAKDLLDLVVCGSSWHVRKHFGVVDDPKYYFWQKRDDFYKKLRKLGL